MESKFVRSATVMPIRPKGTGGTQEDDRDRIRQLNARMQNQSLNQELGTVVGLGKVMPRKTLH